MTYQTTSYTSRFVPAQMREGTPEGAPYRFTSVLDEKAVVEDIFLMPGGRLYFEATAGVYVILPIVGSVWITDESSPFELKTGEYYIAAPGRQLRVAASDENEGKVNFLRIALPQSERSYATLAGRSFLVDIQEKNKLISATDGNSLLSVGVYDSRQKDLVSLNAKQDTPVIYVINGSFEVDGRLMEFRDALLLRDLPEFDFEALAEVSVLLIINP